MKNERKNIMKKNIKKYLSAVISFIMLLNLTTLITYSSQPLDVIDTEPIVNLTENELELPEILTPDAVAGKGHVLRAKDMETELDTATFENIDGSYSTYVFGEPIKYIDENGKVNDKSNALLSTPLGFANVKNDIRVSYPNNIALGIAASYGDYNIRMSPIIPAGVTAGNGVLTSNDGSTVSDKVTYNGVFGNGTRVEYTQTFAGFKEIIVLENDVGISDFSFNLITGGLYIEERDGRLALVDPSTDSTVATLGSLVIWDSEYNYYPGEYSFETVKDNSAYTVTVSCDSINTEDIQYPLYIDPSMTVSDNQDNQNTIYDINPFSFNPNNPNESVYYPETNYWGLYIGKTNGTSDPTARALVKIRNIPDIRDKYKDYTVTSIKYSFTVLMCDANNIPINAHFCMYNWNDATIPVSSYYNNVGEELDEVTLAQKGMSTNGERYEFDITEAMDSWVDGEPNYGIMIKLSNDQDAIVALASAESGITGGYLSNAPYVILNYVNSLDGKIYKLKNVALNNYLSVNGGFAKPEQSMTMASNDDDLEIGSQLWNQEFRLVRAKDKPSQYYINPICSYNGRLTSLGAESETATATIKMYDKSNAYARTFKIRFIENNTAQIVLANNENLVLASSPSGLVCLLTNGSSNNLKWILEYSNSNEIQAFYESMNLHFPYDDPSGTDNDDDTITINSDFGNRDINKDGEPDYHNGLDLDDEVTNVYSMFDGKVIAFNTDWNGEDDNPNDDDSRGFYIIIEATNPNHHVYGNPNIKLRFVFMHLDESASETVKNATGKGLSINQEIEAGTLIGKVGKTGDVTGPHLHISVLIVNSTSTKPKGNCIDPLIFFPDRDFDLD